jgi:hypothetical protein
MNGDWSAGLPEPFTDELREIFHGHGTVAEYGFVVATQIKGRSQLPLNLLSQSIVGHTPHEIGAQLSRRLLGADDLQPRFAL